MIVSKAKEKIQSVKDKIQEKMSLKELIELFRGNTDIEKRASVILNPKMPETSTNLSSNQVDFVGIGKTIKKYFNEFEPLEFFTDEFLLVSESKDGWAVDRMIQHEQAVSEKRLLQLGLRTKERGIKDSKTK